MRITADVDEKIPEQAMKLTGARTRNEALNISLEYLIRKKKIETLKNRLGKFPLEMTTKDLEIMRGNN